MTQEEQAKLNNELLYAAANDKKEEVERLIAAKADVNAEDNNEYTPLHLAAYKGHIEAVRKLIEAEAQVNTVNNNGDTPLNLAVIFGHTDTIKALIAAGADVNTVDEDRQTPLHKAVIFGHTDTIKALIAAGADVNVANQEGKTPLDIARDKSDECYNEVIDAIAKRINNDNEKAKAFKRGIRLRVEEANCPVKMLGGEQGIMEKILSQVASLKLSDIPEGEHRDAVEAKLKELQGKHVDSHATKVAAGRNNDHSQARS